MANVKKALYNVAVFLVSLFITGSIPIRGRARRASLYITKRPGNMNMTGRRTRMQ